MSRINFTPPVAKFRGSFYDTTTQTAASATVAYPITLNTTVESYGVTVNGSSITFQNSGTYNVQFSTQLLGTKTATAEIWIRKNGTNLPWSNSRVSVSNQNPAVLPACNFVLPLVANDVLQFYWATTDIDLTINAASSSGNAGPQIPSMIVTAVEV